MFEKDACIDNVCILQGKRVVGTLTRQKVKERLSGRYGFSLNQKKEVMSIMDNEFLEVDYETPISVVSVMAMNRKEEHLYDFIVVSKKGEYYGIVTVKNLLQKATEIAVNTARLQNPLTGLPGNIVIEREIDHAIHKKSKYTVVYFDLDNFKAFNDVYGFEKGDLIIKEFANILKENIKQNDFIGHIGGDDFVAIFPYWETDNICRTIKNKFAERAKTYYSEEDRAQGYIESFNRKGEKDRFPLVTVTVARENNELKDYTSLYEITESLAAKKKKEKMRA